MPTQYITRRSAALPGASAKANAAPIFVDSDDDKLKIIPAASGTTEFEVPVVATMVTLSADGAAAVTPGLNYITKGSAAAISLAAPGTAMIGKQITFTTGTDFAHVVTFTGSTLRDGTTGASITWTSAAFAGSSVTVVGVTSVLWNVVSNNLGVIA
jgi:hypothetical protein